MFTKIRILLLILTLAFAGTAITIKYTVSKTDVLSLDEQTITQNIHQLEKKIEHIWQDSLTKKTFENVEKYPLQVAQLIKEYSQQDLLYFYIFKNNELVHWSNNSYVPVTDLGLQEKTSFIETDNRTFVTKKKKLDNNISIVAFIPVKDSFRISNSYLKQIFRKSVGSVENVDFATYDDNKNIRNIYSKDNDYLFSIKLKEDKKDNIYVKLQFFCWLGFYLCFLILSNNICWYIAKKGYAWLATILFAAILTAVRLLDLKTNWLSNHSSFVLFDPKNYAYNEFLPNAWSYLITAIFLFWLACFVYTIQSYYKLPSIFRSKKFAVVASFAIILSAYLIGQLIFFYLGTLLTHSPINPNDFTMILNLGMYGWTCILILCFQITTYVLFLDSITLFIKGLIQNITLVINIHLAAFICSIFISYILDYSILLGLLFPLIIWVRTYRAYYFGKIYILSIFIATTLILSVISSVAYHQFNRNKKIVNMEQALDYLQSEDDDNALSLFTSLETEILKDKNIQHLLRIHQPNHNSEYISEYIKANYLSGYLSKFEFQIYFYDTNLEPLSQYEEDQRIVFRSKVINNAVKIPQTQGFYRAKSTLGTHEYFSYLNIPYSDDPNRSFHVYMKFKNLAYTTNLPYPEVLADSRANILQNENFLNNSYALYKDGKLVTQNGAFNYLDNDFAVPKVIHRYIPLADRNGYIHMAYKPDVYTTIVLSNKRQTIWESLAFCSIIFLTYFMFFMLFNGINYLGRTMLITSYRLRGIKYHFEYIINNIQYSSRIQGLVILSVLLGILISGGFAFLSINRQLEASTTQERQIFISEITKKIETNMPNETIQNTQTIIGLIKSAANSTTTNFNLFDSNGKLVYTSQPKIYDSNLVSNYINPEAFNALKILKKSNVEETERVGSFSFKSTYSVIKGEDYKTIAYLNIPYYSSEKLAVTNKNLLLNTILNIYTLILIIFGFISVAVAKKITEPLDIVRHKLAETQLSSKVNEPLYWERNDEIGMLIKEYNYMLIKLEENAKQLRDVERESAWREMAKQVAHEIKNPLTPMKLGIQQLRRSFNDQDPRFEKQFDRVSYSIIEQIDALSNIATEFSAFAKLPETNFTRINLIEKISKVIHLFTNVPNTIISLTNNTGDEEISILGDKDQVLRMFNNLIKNAIEAGSGRKKHRINITIDYMDNALISIKVNDNGSGIPAEVIPQIFVPNFTTKSSGTGLGLAFVKQTVTGMNGEISFETEENIGTTFYIDIPKYKDEHPYA